MPFVADQDDRVVLLGVLHGFEVHFGHQWARGVDGSKLTPAGVLAHGGRDSVGAIEQWSAFGNLVQIVDENGTLVLEPLDHVLVVHDLVVHVDGRSEEFEGLLQALDRHVDPCARNHEDWPG